MLAILNMAGSLVAILLAVFNYATGRPADAAYFMALAVLLRLVAKGRQ